MVGFIAMPRVTKVKGYTICTTWFSVALDVAASIQEARVRCTTSTDAIRSVWGNELSCLSGAAETRITASVVLPVPSPLGEKSIHLQMYNNVYLW